MVVNWSESHQATVVVEDVAVAVQAAMAANRSDPVQTRQRISHLTAALVVETLDQEDELPPGFSGP
jgi:hypothetical protein